MRFSNGAFIPFEENQLEKSEEIAIKSKGKVCRDNCRDTFRKELFHIASIGAFMTPFVGGLLAATNQTISPFAAGIAEGLLLVGVYNYEMGRRSWAEFIEDKFMANCENKCDGGGYENLIEQENDEKLMKVCNQITHLKFDNIFGKLNSLENWQYIWQIA